MLMYEVIEWVFFILSAEISCIAVCIYVYINFNFPALQLHSDIIKFYALALKLKIKSPCLLLDRCLTHGVGSTYIRSYSSMVRRVHLFV